MGYDGSLKFDTKVDESGFNAGIDKLGTIAKGGLAVLAGAVTSFTVITKKAVDEVASLEQNIGGIETLFGTGGAKSVEEYADAVGKAVSDVKGEYNMLTKAQTLALENANKAYKTAGLSANEYMSTVTSFAASLKQSVSDEVEAAKAADQAIIDMSDNANKMGTAMESIQNAYQGFAKQNYTMLDNLKLGYGGTKEEMKRLLEDAEKLSGVEYDISNLADVYEAIHVIQTELGITGTTAKEAATTIEGSMNSAKAAWSNFIAGVATPDELATAIDTAAGVLVENIKEIVPRLAETIPAVAEKLVPTILELGPVLADAGMSILNDFVSGITETEPQLIERTGEIKEALYGEIEECAPAMHTTGIEILTNFISGIVEAIPRVSEKAREIIELLLNGIQEHAPSMLTMGTEMLSNFITGLAQQLPELIPQALAAVVTLADSIISNLPIIVNAGIELLKGIATGIINSLPILIAEGPRIINDFADAVYSALWELVKLGAELIVSLIKGLWESLPLLLENAGEILLMFINIFSLSKLFSLGKSLITNLVDGIKKLGPNVLSAGENIINSLVNGIKSLASNPDKAIGEIITKVFNTLSSIDWTSIGENIISGIVSGLKNGVGSIISAAKNVAENALSAAKKALGIHSPSTVFRDQIGKNMALGVGAGFDKNIPVADMTDTLTDSVQKMQHKVSVVTQNQGESIVGRMNTLYGSNGSGKASSESGEINLYTTNIFEVDGTPLVEKTTKATIQKINKKQKENRKVRGQQYEEVWI